MSTIAIRYSAFEKSRIDFGGNVGGEASMFMVGPSIPPIAVADEDVGAYGWRSSGYWFADIVRLLPRLTPDRCEVIQ